MRCAEMSGSGAPAADQCFLFLQGPISLFFSDLAALLTARGHRVLRVNFNFGDRVFWRGKAIEYRGGIKGWPATVTQILADEGVTDLLLLGEQRPHHRAAIAAAHRMGVRVTVFDYGYLRPDWITCEPDGMGALSRFPRTLEDVRALARATPPHDDGGSYGDSFPRQARLDVTYHLLSWIFWFLYPGYRSHQIHHPVANYMGTAWRLLMQRRRGRMADLTVKALVQTGRPFFLCPMQMEVDYSIRAYSPFADMREVLRLVLASFLLRAPQEAVLVIKLHPLDPGLRRWSRWLKREAARHGPAAVERVLFVDGGSLEAMLAGTRGVVTVNSTVGVIALRAGVPVVALGAAVYDMPGLTWQGSLDDFWNDAVPPDAADVGDFVRALAGSVQLRGVFYSNPGLAAAVMATADRLRAKEQLRIRAALGPSRLGCPVPKAPRAAIPEVQ
jgi:capsular polysaccharide export protein